MCSGDWAWTIPSGDLLCPGALKAVAQEPSQEEPLFGPKQGCPLGHQSRVVTFSGI